MQARIVGHLGVKAEADVRSLRDGHRVVAETGDNLGIGAGRLDERRPDEHRAERSDSERRDPDVRLERLHLTPVAIAPDADVEDSQRDLIRTSVEHLANSSG